MQRFRKYTDGITFFVSGEMRQKLDGISEERQETVSKILREILSDYFGDEKQSTVNTGR